MKIASDLGFGTLTRPNQDSKKFHLPCGIGIVTLLTWSKVWCRNGYLAFFCSFPKFEVLFVIFSKLGPKMQFMNLVLSGLGTRTLVDLVNWYLQPKGLFLYFWAFCDFPKLRVWNEILMKIRARVQKDQKRTDHWLVHTPQLTGSTATCAPNSLRS